EKTSKNTLRSATCNLRVTFIILSLILFSFNAYSEQVETPSSFIERKNSSYKKALEELKKEYRKWCVVAGRPIIPVGFEEGQGQPPGGLGQPPGEYRIVQTPGLGDGDFSYEIEQVYNTWYTSGANTNPFSWVDVKGAFQTTGSKGPSPSGVDECSNKSMNFDTKAPGGPYAGILLDPATNSCKLTKFDPSKSASVWFNALKGSYQFGPDAPTWSGTSNFNAPYNVFYNDVLYTHSSGKKVTITFKVYNRNTSDPNTAQLIVGQVKWK
ncbi:MAG: hypothetical protein N3D15_09990, partial [Syntrophorhabdaceae bacterium]|nr:hypothetical protein [Syntrophorhabdaceae bacterium]